GMNHSSARIKKNGIQPRPTTARREQCCGARIAVPWGVWGLFGGSDEVDLVRRAHHTPKATTAAARMRRTTTLNQPTTPSQPNNERPVATENAPKSSVATPKSTANANRIPFQYNLGPVGSWIKRRKPAQRR